MRNLLRRLRKEIGGQDMVEYALATGMMAVTAVAVLPLLPPSICTVFSRIGSIVQAQIR